MITDTYKRLITNEKGVVVPNRLIELATYVVDNDCFTESGGPIIGEDRTNLITEISWNMLIGSRNDKNRYLVTGIISGIVLTAVGVFTIQKFNKYKKNRA